MTTLLSITARPEAPIACDMSEAEDTPADRLVEYRRLFEHALLARESTPTRITFRFVAGPGVREQVLDLVRREAACCPFLSYEVTQAGDRIVWTTMGTGESDLGVLDALLAESEVAPPVLGFHGTDPMR